MVVVDDESVAMMRGGSLDVEPFLISRNTLGNGKTTTQISKGKYQMVVAECGGGFGSSAGLQKCNDGFWSTQRGSGGYGGGLYTVSELKSPSLSSLNTLGDTNHNSDKLKQN